MALANFHAVIHEEDDGSYWAEVKELPGCFASGFSMEELQEALFEAMQMWLPEGITLEEPRWSPVKERSSGGKAKKRRPRQMLVCA